MPSMPRRAREMGPSELSALRVDHAQAEAPAKAPAPIRPAAKVLMGPGRGGGGSHGPVPQGTRVGGHARVATLLWFSDRGPGLSLRLSSGSFGAVFAPPLLGRSGPGGLGSLFRLVPGPL